MTEKNEIIEKIKDNKCDRNNEKDVKHVTVDISLSLEEGIDSKDAIEYLEKLFSMADKLGELLHRERLTVGEALFVIYMLEKGALSIMDIDDPDDIYHLLSVDNKSRIGMIANMVIRHNAEKDKKEKDEKKN